MPWAISAPYLPHSLNSPALPLPSPLCLGSVERTLTGSKQTHSEPFRHMFESHPLPGPQRPAFDFLPEGVDGCGPATSWSPDPTVTGILQACVRCLQG